jgi:pantetheine-phosphate adenylyltransferase
MKTAVYPGSFDPVTLGHLNIIRRAAAIFDKVYVCVMSNSDKNPMFTKEERVELIRRTVARFPNVEVETGSGLLVEYAKSKDACVIVKGLRAVSDFDWEFQMALANRKIDATIDTLFFASSEKYTYLSSSVVKEMAKYGADLSEFVPREIIADVAANADLCLSRANRFIVNKTWPVRRMPARWQQGVLNCRRLTRMEARRDKSRRDQKPGFSPPSAGTETDGK